MPIPQAPNIEELLQPVTLQTTDPMGPFTPSTDKQAEREPALAQYLR